MLDKIKGEDKMDGEYLIPEGFDERKFMGQMAQAHKTLQRFYEGFFDDEEGKRRLRELVDEQVIRHKAGMLRVNQWGVEHCVINNAVLNYFTERANEEGVIGVA